jgi:murein DD-endopeptidase MepM/ murein hydrolase activator NlpD
VIRATALLPSRTRRLAAALAIGAAAAALATSADSQSATARPAAASAVAYARADAHGARGRVAASGNASRSRNGVSASASTAGGRGRASAGVVVTHVNVFDGLVRASSVRVSAGAGAGAHRSGRVAGLRVHGQKLGTVTGRRVYNLGGRGTLVVLATGSNGISGMTAHLTRGYRNTPKGTTVTIAFASASARDAISAPKPAKPKSRAPAGGTKGKDGSKGTKQPPRRRAPATPAARLRALSTKGGFAFPVLPGRYRFSDDYGAPRQDTGRHEGNDIFAAAGTPVLAVTAGTLRRVGTAPVPGNRLYLWSDRGDYYFYGHLSSFESKARSGLRVKAGQVLGYVGSTGDAEQTPPHVHFEVHPGGGGPVDPYPFLRAWEQHRDVPTAAWLERYGGSRPGTLVVVRDYLER